MNPECADLPCVPTYYRNSRKNIANSVYSRRRGRNGATSAATVAAVTVTATAVAMGYPQKILPDGSPPKKISGWGGRVGLQHGANP